MAAYCSASDVGVEIRKTFNDTDSPTTAEVDKICEEVAREIDGILVKAGYNLPIQDTAFLDYLRGVNRLGAAARVESILYGDAQPGESVRSERLFNWYQKKLKQIMGEAIGSVDDFTSGEHRLPVSFQQDEPDAEGVPPVFTRGMKF
ncbi:MAG: hypothetical protein D6816_02875 [Bacteroidetes bacterium]|nr:MAG: hypothetical protein D6816_02875 [Bacteroidota bacterium]